MKKMWKAHKATARQFKFVIFRRAKLRRHKHLGWLALPPEHWDPAGLSVRDGSQFILMLWNIKAKCTFNRSKKFSAAQGPRANDLDHNNAYYSITVHCFAGNRVWVIFHWFHTLSAVGCGLWSFMNAIKRQYATREPCAKQHVLCFPLLEIY